MIGVVVYKMSVNRIVVLVVMKDDVLVGIIFEKDIVCILVDDGLQVGCWVIFSLLFIGLEGIVLEVMLKQVMLLMMYLWCCYLMVIEGICLVGIFSLGDIVKNLLGELELEKVVLQDIYMVVY